MEWHWSGDDVEESMWVHEDKELQTSSGRYDVFINKARRTSDDGTYTLRTLAFLEGSHRRAYEEIHVSQPGSETVTQTITYDPPAPFPFWETIRPGKLISLNVTTTTSTMVGLQVVDQETNDWRWVAKADEEKRNFTTDAGTFEGYKVSVYKKNHETGNVTEHRFFYSPEVRHYQAILDGQDSPTIALDDFTLDPPPVAHGQAIPSLPVAGEAVTLDASRSFDRDGNISAITWELPDGTVLHGETVNTTFDEAGRFRVTLEVTDDHGQTSRVPVPIRVVEAGPRVELVGPTVAEAGEPTPFRLIIPDNKTARQVTWSAPGMETVRGQEVELEFPRSGGYTVTVSFLDSDGNTGRLTHGVQVFGDRGDRASQDAAGAAGNLSSRPPAILEPTNMTKIDREQVLVVARVAGLEDPAIVAGNGLRIPLAQAGGLATAEVPLTGDRSVLTLVDGHDTVDRVIVVHDSDASTTANDSDPTDPDTRDTPVGALAILLTLTLTPFLWRRDR